MNDLRQHLALILDRLRDRWELLSPTDQKRYKVIAAVLFALLILLIFSPFLRARLEARSRLKEAESQLREAMRIEEDLLAHGIVPAERKSRGLERSLLGTMEQLARRAEISTKISSMRPIQRGSTTQEGIEVEVHDIVLEQMLRFLYLVEGEGKLLVSRMEVAKEIKNPNRLKLNLEVFTP